MRIEILSNGIGSVSSLQNSLSGLHTDINSTIESLQGVKKKLNNITGGAGNLSGAVNSIQRRINTEEAKLASVAQLSQKTNTFLSNTIAADTQVAAMVAQNQQKFFNEYTWLRPVAEEEKSWWEKFVDGWNDFWGDVGEALKSAWEGIVSFVKEHAVELIIGAIAIVVGAAIIALTGGAAAAFIPALLAGLKAAAISALISGTISSVIALLTGGDVLAAFGDGLASGFMWGGIFFVASSAFSAIRTWISSGKGITKGEQVAINKGQGDIFEQQEYAKFKTKYSNAERQITIETVVDGNPVKFRIDQIAEKNGQFILNEIKSSSTAPLTIKQKIAWGSNLKNGSIGILENGGIIKGAGKGIFSGGTVIPPGTTIEIIRPQVPVQIVTNISNISKFSIFPGGFGGIVHNWIVNEIK